MKRVRLSRKLATWLGAAAAAVAAVLVLVGIDLVWTDYLWYQSLGQTSVFWIRFVSQASVWLGCTAVGFAITYVSARSAWKSVAEKPRFNALTVLACLTLSGVMGWTMSQKWMVFRLAVAQAPFGIKDPQFGLDVGFFVFTLPALELLNRWLAGLCILAMVIVVGIAFVATRLDTAGDLSVDWQRLKETLSILGGFLALTAAANYWIAIYQLSFSVAETPFAGASYADIHAQLPADWMLVVISIGVAITLFATAGSRRLKPVAVAFGVWAIAAVLLGSLWPMLVETYVAAPNDATLEAPYLARNIAMTRAAYDLTGVKGRPYPALTSLSASASAAAQAELQDATVWTPSSVRQAFDQLQQIRPYYKLSPTEFDRYEYDGTLHQVLVAAREIDTSGLPARRANVGQQAPRVHTRVRTGHRSTRKTSTSGPPDVHRRRRSAAHRQREARPARRA